MDDWTHLKVASMRNHLMLIAGLVDQNEIWVRDMNDPEIAKIHHDLIDLFAQTAAQYNRLLEKYQIPDLGDGE
jgi:hypothetical protein